MEARRRRAAARKPVAPAEKPKPKRPVVRDMSIYARHLKLPMYPGFNAVSKLDVSKDVRLMAGLPIPATLDPERDTMLLAVKDAGAPWAEGRGLLPKPLVDALKGKPLAEPIEAEAANLEEKPEVVAALEAALYRGEEDEEYWAKEEEYNDLALPAPSRALTGWTAARLTMEGSARVTSTRAPLAATGPVPPVFVSGSAAGAGASAGASAAGGSAAGAGASVLTFGQPRGSAAGHAMGMEGVRMDFGLLDRLQGTLPVRRAETESRYLALRRQYVAALKEYYQEAQEMGVSIESLRSHAASVRASLRPGNRPDAFATDAEEWLAVDRMAASMAAVVRQNAQLRARLAAATGRASGNAGENEPLTAEEAQAAPASSPTVSEVLVLTNPQGVVVGGGAKPYQPKAKPIPGLVTAAGKDKDGDEEMGSGAGAGAAAGGSAKGAAAAGAGAEQDGDAAMTTGTHPYHVRSRHSPRTTAPLEVAVAVSAQEPVLAMGDLVLTPYGRGVVVRQRDLDLLKGKPGPFSPTAEAGAGAGTGAGAGAAKAAEASPATTGRGGRKGAAGKAGGGHAGGAAASPQEGAASAASAASAVKPVTSPTTTMVEVLLRFGARSFILSSQVVLLAVAGEEYTGPESGDASLLQAVLAARAAASGRPAPGLGRSPVASSNGVQMSLAPMADDLLYGPKKPSPAGEAAAAAAKAAAATAGAGATPGPSSAAARAKAVGGSTAVAGLHGSSSAEVDAEMEWEKGGAAEREAVRISVEDGMAINHRVPVFRTPWERNRVPRGVPLRIDPLRGTSTLGYMIGGLSYGGLATLMPGYGSVISALAMQGVGSSAGAGMGLGLTSSLGAAAGGSAGAGAGSAHADPTPHASPGDGAVGAPGSSLAGIGTPGSAFPTTPGAPREATQQVRELFAEVQRLRGQLKQSDESRAEQKKRLTDARVTIARLLQQLNAVRTDETEVEAELTRREKEVSDLQDRIHELREKYEPQALAADELREAQDAARKAAGGRTTSAAEKAMEALMASMSAEGEAGDGDGDDGNEDGNGDGEEDESTDEDVAMPVSGAGASSRPGSSPLKPGLPASSPGARLSLGGTASASGSRVKASTAAYRGIMIRADEEEAELGSDSDKELEEASRNGKTSASGGAGGGAEGEGLEDEEDEETGEGAALFNMRQDAGAGLGVDADTEGTSGLMAALSQAQGAGAGAGAGVTSSDDTEALLVGSLNAAAPAAGAGAGTPGAAGEYDSDSGALVEEDNRRVSTGRGRGRGRGQAARGRGRGRGGAAAAAKRPRDSLEDEEEEDEGDNARRVQPYGGTGSAAGSSDASAGQAADAAGGAAAATSADSDEASLSQSSLSLSQASESGGTGGGSASGGPARRGRSAAGRGRR